MLFSTAFGFAQHVRVRVLLDVLRARQPRGRGVLHRVVRVAYLVRKQLCGERRIVVCGGVDENLVGRLGEGALAWLPVLNRPVAVLQSLDLLLQLRTVGDDLISAGSET
jgi:hypothetical protein